MLKRLELAFTLSERRQPLLSCLGRFLTFVVRTGRRSERIQPAALEGGGVEQITKAKPKTRDPERA